MCTVRPLGGVADNPQYSSQEVYNIYSASRMVGSQPGTRMGRQVSSNLSRTSFPPLCIENQHLSSDTRTSSNKRGIPSWKMSKQHVFPNRLQEKAIPVARTTSLSLTRHAKVRYPPSTSYRRISSPTTHTLETEALPRTNIVDRL